MSRNVHFFFGRALCFSRYSLETKTKFRDFLAEKYIKAAIFQKWRITVIDNEAPQRSQFFSYSFYIYKAT